MVVGVAEDEVHDEVGAEGVGEEVRTMGFLEKRRVVLTMTMLGKKGLNGQGMPLAMMSSLSMPSKVQRPTKLSQAMLAQMTMLQMCMVILMTLWTLVRNTTP